MQGITRTHVVAVLLVGILACVTLAAGCGGEASKESTEDPASKQDTQQTKEETTDKAKDKASGSKAREGEATLEMRGDEGTEFSGSCTVGNETSTLDGQAPETFTYQLDGERLECEISADGNLQVVLNVGNSRSIQQISGGTLNLTYDNGQISSSSISSGSGGSSSSSQVVSQSSSSSVKISP